MNVGIRCSLRCRLLGAKTSVVSTLWNLVGASWLLVLLSIVRGRPSGTSRQISEAFSVPFVSPRDKIQDLE